MPVSRPRPWSAILWPCLVCLLFLVASVSAQSSANNTASSNSQSSTQSPSLSLTTGSTTITTTVHSGNTNVPVATVVPTTFNVTVTPSPTSSQSTTTAPAQTTSAAPDFTKLDTHLDPGFGVLGAILILTGLPSAFLGYKNRWSSFFLIGFYTLSVVCFVLILRFGVLQAVNPPNATLRGLFVLSSVVAGIAGGGIAIFFWKAAKYFTGAWGGFALALWIQCFRNGGVIHPLGFRWIMYIVVSVIGFVLCTIPKLHYYIMLTSTAFVGATAFMLGVDCFTTAGLKEFYVWNIGFDSLFTKYTQHGIQFPVTQIMEIELGMMGAVAIMGIAVQFQILKILMRKMKEIEMERKRQDLQAEARAAERFKDLEAEMSEWERTHPSSLAKHGRADSNFSGLPLLGKDGALLDSPSGTPRPRYQSGLSEFMAAPTPAEELNRAARQQPQSTGILPTLDLGDDIEANVPETFIVKKADSNDSRQSRALTPGELDDLRRREELLSEIQGIRRSIEILRADTPVPIPSSSSESRHPSQSSRHLSQDLSAFGIPAPAHLRPPRQRDPRARVQSMELTTLSNADAGTSIGRPTSAPLRDDNWEMYLHERKLFQPPSGTTAPIATTPMASPPPKVPVSPAVVEALKERQRRESALSGQGDPASAKASSEDLPLALRPQHRRATSQGGSIPVTILPPKRPVAQPAPKSPESPAARVKTFEELVERHQKKLRELQDPITQAEKEQADISNARDRWQRAKNAEKQSMAKRQAEKEQAAKKERKSGEGRRGGAALASPDKDKGHRRSLSADVLANVPGSGTPSKRMSTMKVEDWQRHQLDEDAVPARPLAGAHNRPGSSSMARRQSGVPFPEAERDRRRMSQHPRDPLS
ncbi:hypothetical protein DICSQDRAFT_151348 [Dichomitus squalens LYAD-421 SS1]|uniref:uncharacterized protein n=1 Tax=Dichomitus squalens (strain LYAD-421) TaxID=732165 RepID=UPI0004410F91|nr:uncharacterized protein DICSQDRAFT_151348 [Dichomitus squalens LYAD-421 SS1]EJF66964.1 hypothetical protein DICSQDRAFT_151348 [Dichomitus squalens LYAD-421 SS1]